MKGPDKQIQSVYLKRCKTRLLDFLFALYLFHLPLISYKYLGLRTKNRVLLEYQNKLATFYLYQTFRGI
jgi:hypothetical protein